MNAREPRLILADPSDDDLALLADWLCNTSGLATLYSGGRGRPNAAGLRQSIDLGRESYLMLVTHADARRVGFVSYRNVGDPAVFDVGIGLGDPAEWGSGFGAEGFALLLDLLFHQRAAHRVQVTVAAYNRNSLRLLQRGGFTVEGVLRDARFLDGARHDTVIASILAPEYYAADLYQPIPDLIPADEKRRAKEMLQELKARSHINNVHHATTESISSVTATSKS